MTSIGPLVRAIIASLPPATWWWCDDDFIAAVAIILDTVVDTIENKTTMLPEVVFACL